MDLAIRLKTKRKELGINQEELANQIHVSRQTVSNWETGRTLPDINSLILISDIYEISLDELIKGDIKMLKKLNSDSKQTESWFVTSNIISTALSLFISTQSDSLNLNLIIVLLLFETVIISYISYNGFIFLKNNHGKIKNDTSLKIYTTKYIITANHILYFVTLLCGTLTILITALTL